MKKSRISGFEAAEKLLDILIAKMDKEGLKSYSRADMVYFRKTVKGMQK